MILNTTFGLTKIPFVQPEKPDGIIISEQLKYLEARFQDLLKTKGLFLFSGDSGSGKSTAIKYLIHKLSHRYKPVYMTKIGRAHV